jgi:carbonic anhydrase
MKALEVLFRQNAEWAARMEAREPGFFARLSRLQAPKYLWIGCSDSRVPANEIIGLLPGELFVHRNVANLVLHADLNCLSVMQFAVDVLKVEHIIVCGHYGCGGVRAALDDSSNGLVDNWLRPVQDVRDKHAARIGGGDDDGRARRLCELNVVEQALNACHTTIVRDAWARGQTLWVHAWIYALDDGLLRDLRFTVNGDEEVESAYREALQRQPERGAVTR